PLHKRWTAAYLIGRDEVTFDDWLAYVDAQPPARRAALAPSAPTCETSLAITPDGNHWRFDISLVGRRYTAGWGEPIVYTGRHYHERQDWRKFPIVDISDEDAMAYAAWLDRTKRLPNAR